MSPQPTITVSDRAVARIVARTAADTPGVTALLPGSVQSMVRGAVDPELAAVVVDRRTGVVTVHLAVALDPPPLRTVALVARRVRAEVERLTGETVEPRVVVAGID